MKGKMKNVVKGELSELMTFKWNFITGLGGFGNWWRVGGNRLAAKHVQ